MSKLSKATSYFLKYHFDEKNMSKDKCIIENKTNFNNGMDGKGVFFCSAYRQATKL